ncbi:MAG: VanZ family protein [Eubacteriales bacterium]
MYRILPVLWELVPAAVLLLPLTILLQQLILRRPKPLHCICVALFSLYLFAVFSVTGMPALGTVAPQAELHLIPFSDAASDVRGFLNGCVLNILLFIPLGYAAPLLWHEFRRLPVTLLLGFSLSLFIELMQLCTFRLTDVDDLLMNTLGALLGWGAAMAALRHPKIAALAGGAPAGCGREELTFTAAVVFLYNFFIQPYASRLLWG